MLAQTESSTEGLAAGWKECLPMGPDHVGYVGTSLGAKHKQTSAVYHDAK